MDTTQHYSELMYSQPHPIPPAPANAPRFPEDIASWSMSTQHPQTSSSASHAPMPHMMNHSQDQYAPPSTHHSFLSRHVPDTFTHHHPPSPSIDPGPSSNPMSFESPQIPGSIGPDRGLSRRRARPPGRVQSHGELPDYAAMPETHDPAQNSHYPSHQGSRPQTPSGPGAPEQFVQQLPDQSRLSFHSPYGPYQPFPFSQPQSRSTSGSAGSATSNPRSASPALSVASALTSVSSSASIAVPQSMGPASPLARKEPNKKKRLYNTDRRNICVYARAHPGMKQEDIALKFGVERSTVSKILKHKHRWLSVAENEAVQIAKMRPSKFPDLEYRLAEWVKSTSKSGTILSDALLRQRAREIGDSLGFTPDKFKASSGWLENFKHRHGIRRGVWTGSGFAEVKARAYAEGFIPPGAENHCPPGPFATATSPDEDPQPGYDMGNDSGHQGRPMHQSPQAMHPSSSLALQPPWPRSDQQTSNGESSSSGSVYPPEDQPQYSMREASQEPEQPVVEAAMPPAEPVAIQLGPEDGGNGEQVFVLPVMPEVIPDDEVPDDAEAEKALDKVLAYVRANHGELELSGDPGFQLLFELKYKLFGKATGQPYDPRYVPKLSRS